MLTHAVSHFPCGIKFASRHSNERPLHLGCLQNKIMTIIMHMTIMMTDHDDQNDKQHTVYNKS
jgi:hypothetical protein